MIWKLTVLPYYYFCLNQKDAYENNKESKFKTNVILKET